MNRRVFLKAVSGSSVAGLAVLAGCTSGASGDNGSDNTSGESGGTTAGSATGGERNATAVPTGTNGTGANGTGTEIGTNGTGTSANGSSNATDSASKSGGTKTVGMHTEGGNYYFDPIGVFVETGTTVTFEVESGAHSSTAYEKGNPSAAVTRIPEGAEAWNSDTLPEGKTFDHTFETEGTYDYFCLPHKALGMVGRVVVGSPGGPAEGSMPPDGKVPESTAIVEQGTIAYSDFS